MAILITSVSKQVIDNGVKILVHGPAGAGKTVLCATTGKPTLIISAEGGLLSIKDAPKYIKATEVKTISDIQEILDFLVEDAESDSPSFEWICLDSITEIAEKVLDYEKQQSRDARNAYGNLQTHMMNLLRNFRDLKNYNVVMTCKQDSYKDEYSGLIVYHPMMPGAKLAKQIPYIFDEVFALRVEEDDEDGTEYRVLQTSRDKQFEAKDRSGVLDMFEKPNLKHIRNKIIGDTSENDKDDGEKPIKNPKANRVQTKHDDKEVQQEAEVEVEVDEQDNIELDD